MKIRNLIGLALIGSALYAHKQHGGDWTIESFKRSARDLFSGIEHGTRRAAESAKQAAERAQHRAQEVGERVANRTAEVGDRVASRVEETSSQAQESFGNNGNPH
jgi:hypothetical protein